MWLNSSRVHQLLGFGESTEILRWLSQRRDQEAAPCQGHADLHDRLASEMDAFRALLDLLLSEKG